MSGDPVQLTFAPALNVKLDSAELRPSGLYVHDVVVGTGEQCDSMATAAVHYTGWLADGTEFDGSRKSGEPIRFTDADFSGEGHELYPRLSGRVMERIAAINYERP